MRRWESAKNSLAVLALPSVAAMGLPLLSAVGLRRFEHEADVREVRVVGVVVVGAVDRDVLDHQVTPLRDDDTRRVLPVREVAVEAHVLLFNRHDLHFTPLAKSAISRHRLESC